MNGRKLVKDIYEDSVTKLRCSVVRYEDEPKVTPPNPFLDNGTLNFVETVNV